MTAGTARFPAREVRVLDALRLVSSARRSGGGGFTLESQDLTARAVLDGLWLRVEATTGNGESDAECRLAANTGLRGAAKWVRDGDAAPLRLVADAWCGDESLQRRVRSVWDDLVAAAKAARTPSTEDVDGEHEAGTIAGLADMLGEGGWKVNGHDDGSVTVDLEVERDYFVADVRAGEDCVLCSVELVAGHDLDAGCRRAVTEVLLGAGAVLRLARGAAVTRRGRLAYRFEVALDTTPAPDELDRALRALAVAAAHYGPEARALVRPELARLYASVRG